MIVSILFPIAMAFLVKRITSEKNEVVYDPCPPHNWSRDIVSEQLYCLQCGKLASL